jgi:sensor domain CHASE-containing protein
MSLALQMGPLPGGMELVIIMLIFLLLAIPVAVLVLLVVVLRGRSSGDEDEADLEERVATLEDQLEAETGDSVADDS